LWESSDPGSRQEAARMLEDISILLSAKKGKLSPMELYINRLSTDYVTLGLVRPAFMCAPVTHSFCIGVNVFKHYNDCRIENFTIVSD
jgi:hypothetical protein